MIDIHCHILPQMDDGSKSLEETAQMLALLQQQGVTTVAATPHFYANRENPESFLRRRGESLAMVDFDPSLPRILPGAEVAYFSGISTCEDIVPMQLGDSGLLLVEMPFCAWSDRMIDEICFIKQRLGVSPVLAHIDRYRNKKQFPKYCKTLVDNHIYFQCNASFFSHLWKRHWALDLLKKGHIQFLGSDGHNMTTRQPNLEQANQVIAKALGTRALNRFHSTAKSLLFPDGF